MDERALYALAVADGKTNQDYVSLYYCFHNYHFSQESARILLFQMKLFFIVVVFNEEFSLVNKLKNINKAIGF